MRKTTKARGAKRRMWTDAQRRNFCRQWQQAKKQGWTFKRFCAKVKISEQTIRTWLKKFNMAMPSAGSRGVKRSTSNRNMRSAAARKSTRRTAARKSNTKKKATKKKASAKKKPAARKSNAKKPAARKRKATKRATARKSTRR
ncbi:MAG: hypothetical protein AAF581_09355 [Planctomycetota bacterium]